MTGSAQLDTITFEPLGTSLADTSPADTSPAGSLAPCAVLPSALKLQVAERLEAHRRRKSSAPAPSAAPSSARQPASPSRRASLAATVAERYAQTPSYRAFLAEQAQLAIEQAAAAADIAVRSAKAVTEAQQNLLAELELWTAPQQFTPATAQTISAESAARASREHPPQANAAGRVRVPLPEASGARLQEHSTGALNLSLYTEPTAAEPTARPASSLPQPVNRAGLDPDEAFAIDDEIAFRQSPSLEDFAAYAEPPVPLAANLLEFPRQLIATRKARPRIAEGPLLEESAPRSPQLRIFEVEAEQFAAQPSEALEAPSVQSFIYLDSEPASEAEHAAGAGAVLNAALVPETASIPRRLLALAIDLLVVGAAVAAAAETAFKIAGILPAGVNAAIASGAALIVFWIVYQLLFFTLSDHTPGMRCARIGLCTLSDENPSRTAMRRRVLAQWIAILPFGMGMLWALLDDDRLGWHDRISQMYQRPY